MCQGKSSWLSCLFTVLLLALVCDAQADTGFLDKHVSIAEQDYRYQVYIPANYQVEQDWPAVVFLHGAGERGANPMLATEVGLGSAIRRSLTPFPAIVIFPQCPTGEWWSSAICEQIALQTLAQVQQQYRIDARRLYLSGLSMGGYGVWHLAATYPNKWAALYAIAGRVKPAQGHAPAANSIADKYTGEALYQQTAAAVAHLPVWIAHGSKDNIVPVTESRKMHQYLTEQGANVTYREYKQQWHNVWDQAYKDADSIRWMLKQVQQPRGN